jgi:hypothetical protein
VHIPVLPLRDMVVYPHGVHPLFVGTESSIRALDSAMADFMADNRQRQPAAAGLNFDCLGNRLNEFFTMRHEHVFQLMRLVQGCRNGFSGPHTFQYRPGTRQRASRDEPAAAGVAAGKMQLDAAVLEIDEIQSIDQLVQLDLATAFFHSGIGAARKDAG